MNIKFGGYKHFPLATREKYDELDTLNRRMHSELGIKSSNVWDSADNTNPGDYLSITGAEYNVLRNLTNNQPPEIQRLVAIHLRDKGALKGIGVEPEN